MSQKNIQKKTSDSKSNIPSKPSTSQNQVSKKSDEKVNQKQNLVTNKNVKTSLNTINKNNIKLKTNSNTNEVKKTISSKAKSTENKSSNSFKNETQTLQQNSKPSQKNKEIVKKDKTILDEKQKRLKVVEQNDSKKKIIVNKNLTKGEPNRTPAQILTNKVSSNQSNLLLDTLEANISYNQFPGRSSESILAEPPSELHESINNITDNQSDHYGSDYYDDFEDYESDFEDDDEDDEEQNQNKESIKAKTFDNNLLINKNEELFQFENHLNNNEKTLKSQDFIENSENGFSSRQTNRIESAFLSIASIRSAQIKSESKVHMNKAIKRANELLEIIKLNKVTFINCDLPSINYDIFIKTFGRRDAKQVSCQTCERQHIQIQTENVSRINKWTQNPSFSRIDAGNDDEENKITCLMPNTDPFKLSKFLIKAETIMTAIIDCEYSDKSNKTALPSGAEKFSKSYSTLKCLDLAKKCPISYTFTNGIYLFCVQNVTKTAGSAEKSVIVVWNLLSEKPQNRAEKVLICRSHIVCAYSEDSIVVAAMIDGSVALWDLNEESHHHKEMIVDNHKFVLRSPSYNSATTGNGHNCAVVAITRISYDLDPNSSHFATIDETGLLIIWAFVEVKGDSNDLGVSPTSHWRLTRNSIIKCLDKFEFETKVSVTSFECQPNDCSQFYCGTDNGLVIRCSTREEVVNHLPNTYKNSELNSFWTSVKKISFNKSTKNSFLVGYSDGSIAYYRITSESPLTLLQTKYSPIIDLKWLSDKNCSFIAFNKSNQIFIYDLTSDETKPLVSYKHLNNSLLSMSLWKGMETKLLFGTHSGNALVFTYNHLSTND